MKRKQTENGTALITVLSLSSVLLILGSLAATHVMREQKVSRANLAQYGQATNVAQAGLQEGIGWFKSQGWVRQEASHACKDAAFDPAYSSDIEARETDDETIGIVRDYQIERNTYGRYILRKNPCGANDPSAVRDISSLRGKNNTFDQRPNIDGDNNLVGDGNAWYLESEGVVYQRYNFTKTADGVFIVPPEASPNRIISRSKAAVEISRLAVNVNASPVTLFGNAGHNFGGRCSLIGADPAGDADFAVYWQNSNPNIASADKTPDTLGKSSLSDPVTPESVFAVSKEELKAMSDNVYTSMAEIPSKAIPFSITYLQGNFSFGFAKPLQGGGLLFVDGDLTLQDNSNSLFSGVIYVTGQLTIGQDNSLSGHTFASRMVCNPSNGSATLEFNRSLINSVRSRLALYRENNLTHVIRDAR